MYTRISSLILPIAAVLALGAVPAVANTAMSSPTIVNCAGKAQHAPRQLTLFCGDGNDNLSSIHWTGWGSWKATATATDEINLCQPDCAAGHEHSYPVSLAATDLGATSDRYGKLTVTFTGARPKGQAKTSKFALGAHGPVIE
jgi:hypothetical protein